MKSSRRSYTNASALPRKTVSHPYLGTFTNLPIYLYWKATILPFQRRRFPHQQLATRGIPAYRPTAGVNPALCDDRSDEELLDLRMCDLGLELRGTWLAGCVAKLCRELERRKIPFCPHAWLSHDWFSPDGVPGIAIPFYLAHPRLMRLEYRQIRDVEGGSREACMKILRHESGHAVQHAYQLQRRRGYQQLFGKSSQPYPESYRPHPRSRRYVYHLPLYYAQSHPDEDFAETFAVWLQHRATWRECYRGWPALNKLQYVDAVMEELKDTPPLISSRKEVDPIQILKMTLRKHYAARRDRYERGYPDIYDHDLRRLFSDQKKSHAGEHASKFLRDRRDRIRNFIGDTRDENGLALELVLDDMIGRCRELRLRAVGSKREMLSGFTRLLKRKTKAFLSRRLNRIAL